MQALRFFIRAERWSWAFRVKGDDSSPSLQNGSARGKSENCFQRDFRVCLLWAGCELWPTKTASLFVLCAKMGTILTETPEPQATVVVRAAFTYGMSYQLLDDLRDLFSSREEIGSAAGADLGGRLLTLPVLIGLYQLHDPRDRQKLEHLIKVFFDAPHADSLAVVQQRLVQSGAAEKSLTVLSSWVAKLRSTVAEGAAESDSHLWSDFSGMARGLSDMVEALTARLSTWSDLGSAIDSDVD